ncbi:hypothetical protein GGR57DRAFT_512350 [Xylariaceae sp. FL1272]|nr:hypothetical protein GGR57DRAFT_512350 [Xylariaceae sp. FL1272]
MDLHMDLRVGFGEDFSFDSQTFPCNSSSGGSFTSASTTSSTQDPFTPTSGCSTPGLQPMLMEHEIIASGASSSYGITPPSSAFGGYFPSETKVDLPHGYGYEPLSGTPSRRASVQPHAGSIDFEYAPIMSTPTASQGHPVQSTNSQSFPHYSFGEAITSPPLEYPPPSYSLENSAFEIAPAWPWPNDSPVNLFEKRESPGPLSLREIPLRERQPAHVYIPVPGRRHMYDVDHVQQRTTALHRAQGGRMKRKRTQEAILHMDSYGEIPIPRCPKGGHRCPYEICSDRKAFKRQEHLKRHIQTVHEEHITTICEFCTKKFNRRDNWRSHLVLHTKKDASGRTPYHERAQAVLDEEMRKTKQRNFPKKKTSVT